jgi:hypothetical protein
LVPTDLVLIDADWNDPALAGAQALLTRMHELATPHDAEQLRQAR